MLHKSILSSVTNINMMLATGKSGNVSRDPLKIYPYQMTTSSYR